MPKNTEAQIRAAIDRTAKKNMDRAAQSGRPVTFSDAKRDATKQAETYQRKYDK